MTDVSDQSSDSRSGRTEPARCRSCGQPARAVQSILNPRTGEAARLFNCTACGSVNWMDDRR